MYQRKPHSRLHGRVYSDAHASRAHRRFNAALHGKLPSSRARWRQIQHSGCAGVCGGNIFRL